jgi:hypothetical protein
MPDTKISGLPAATLPLAGSEQVPIVQDGETKRASVQRFQYRDRPAAYISGGWYSFNGPATNSTSANAPTGVFMLRPFFVSETFTADQFGVDFAATPDGQIVAALYATDPTTKLPTGAPLLNTGLVTPTLSRWVASISGNITLEPGIYWVGVQAETTCNFRGSKVPAGWFLPQPDAPGAFPSRAYSDYEYRVTRSFADAPNLTGSTLVSSGQVRGGHMYFRLV